MKRRLIFLAALLSLSSIASSAFAQKGPLPPDKALAALKVADGFQVELFAAEPMLINPTSMDVDHKGRVWVAEAVNYRRTNFGRPIIRPEGDRIVVLVDEKGEGKATKAVTFYQGKEIYGPLGVCVVPFADGKGQKVFVCQSPDILLFEDKDGDLKADGPPKKFLTGFRGFDHDHGVHGLNIGPDGKLYFTVGDAGVGGLQSSDGKGRKWTSNNTDCRAGTVWRCDMDGTNLELIAHNFRNNYECCVDSFGEIWLSDNDDDGNKQTRICFVMPGGNYGYHPRGAGQTHWHEEQPGIVHKTLRTGQGSPTGITFYEGNLFPKKYQGAILHCDCAPSEVRWFFRKPKGAGYELEKELLLTSSDNWFRPSDVCVAPDGSIFVADWYDRGVGGHGMGDPTDGRIYRITPKGHKGYTVPEVKLDTKEGILAAMGSPNQATRWIGGAAIRALPEQKTFDLLGPAFKDQVGKSDLLRVRMLWQIPQLPKVKDKARFGSEIEREAEPEAIRILGVRMEDSFLGPDGVHEPEGYITGAKLKLPLAIAREKLLLLRKAQNDRHTLLNFYLFAALYPGNDHFYLAALNIACGTDPKRRDAILADFDKHFPEWNDKVADLVWELRPKSVLPRLGKLLADPKLTSTQKGRIVDILATSDDPTAGLTMLDVLKSNATSEVKAQAIANLKLFLPTKWKSLQNSKELTAAVDALLADEKMQTTGLQLIAAASIVARADDVANVARNAKALELRKEAVRTLGKLPSLESAESLLALGTPKNPLTLDCIAALGEQLPKGRTPPAYSLKALEALQLAVTIKESTPEIRFAAISALTANRAGSQWLLDAHTKNGLPNEVIAEVGRLLRNSPYADLANRAKLTFPAPGKLNPKSLPAIAILAKRSGDAARGKLVWNSSATGAAQCAKCHMVNGVGGQVGPDLSMIGKKASRENLYDSILTPSKAIADQYIQHSVRTTAEVAVSGLLVADSPESITLRDANGKDTTIAKKEIEGSVRKLKTSLMPEDIVAGLTEDELIDLVAYLETLKVAALTPDHFDIVGPFPAKSMDIALDTKFGPENAAFDPKATFATQGNESVDWKIVRPDSRGYFDLAARYGNAATNSTSYMHVAIDSPSEQTGEVLLGPDDGARLWINGKEVHVSRESKAASPAAHKIPVKLTKGKNIVLLKIANGNNPHGFYFSLTSPEETKMWKE